MVDLAKLEVWFATGSQHLYGNEILKTVAQHSTEIAQSLSRSEHIPVKVVVKPVLTTPEAIEALCVEANNTPNCIGVIAWMHTFSPAKMWLGGLRTLTKPMVHLHTQYNARPALGHHRHGLHESEPVGSRRPRIRFPGDALGSTVKSWWDIGPIDEVHRQFGHGCRAAAGWHESQQLKIARFGDNMREVAVTEGDKVEAQSRFRIFGEWIRGERTRAVPFRRVSDAETTASSLNMRNVTASTTPSEKAAPSGSRCGIRRGSSWDCEAFLEDGGFQGFHRHVRGSAWTLPVPGIAVQRLMADGYGFGAEGDWKTAALVRTMKVMSTGMTGRDILHGRLHVPFQSLPSRAWRPHA